MQRTKLFNSFLAFDALAPEFKFNIDGQLSLKTCLGVTLTLVWAVALLLGSFYSFQGFFKTDAPISSSEVIQQDNYPPVDLKQNTLVPILFVYLGDTELLEASRINSFASIHAVIRRWDATDRSKDMTVTDTVIPAVACKEIENKEQAGYKYLDSASFLGESMESSGICFDLPDKSFIQGKQSDDLFIEIKFKIKPCSLETGCASMDEVNSLNFYFAVPQISLLKGNLEEPYSQSMNVDFLYYVNSATSQLYTARIKNNLIKDYRGLPPVWNTRTSVFDIKDIFYNPKYRSPTQVRCSAADLHSDTCSSYFEFSMQSSGAVLNYARTYKTIVQTFAEIGGINQFIYTLVFLLYIRYHTTATKKFLLKKAFNFFRRWSPQKNFTRSRKSWSLTLKRRKKDTAG